MYENEDDERPVGQKLRVVELLDISPGRAQDPDNGRPIAILTVLFKGELDQPMMFSLKDVRRLAIGFLAAVAHHEGGPAEEIMSRHFCKENGEPNFAALDPIIEPSMYELSRQSQRPIEQPMTREKTCILATATMRFHDKSIKPVELGVIAGYRSDGRTLLVCQCRGLSDAPVILLGVIGPRRSLTMLAHVDSAVLHAATRMNTLSIEVEGQRYRRLTVAEFRRAVGNKKFTFRPPKNQRKRL
jgi:hypothetical protein